MEFTEQRNLRGGKPCWAEPADFCPNAPLPANSEILIVGAGVMGAHIADSLSADGREVTLVDRRAPSVGSTAASTALVMWAADVPLTHLARRIGLEEATMRWNAVHDAAIALRHRIEDEAIACDRMDRPEIYLEGNLLDSNALKLEAEARHAAGFPCHYLPADNITERFDISPRAGIVCKDSYVLDPVKLTLGLLTRVASRGGRVCYPFEATGINHRDGEIEVALPGGDAIRCRQLILATGYERARWFLPAAFDVGSSYAIATRPDTPPLWREDAMIWEASTGYLYARRTIDGRIITGGGDEDFADAHQRDVLIERKAGLLQGQLSALTNAEPVSLDCAWAASFGSSPDGLPAIGRSSIDSNVWVASGFGGNGITFAALAADIINKSLRGVLDPRAAMFDPDRFGY